MYHYHSCISQWIQISEYNFNILVLSYCHDLVQVDHKTMGWTFLLSLNSFLEIKVFVDLNAHMKPRTDFAEKNLISLQNWSGGFIWAFKSKKILISQRISWAGKFNPWFCDLLGPTNANNSKLVCWSCILRTESTVSSFVLHEMWFHSSAW